MPEEILKFTKIWFLIAGFIQLCFAIAFFFLYDWFFRGIQQWPFDDQGLALLFGGAVLSLSVMNFLVFFKANRESVKIPLITIIVFCLTGFGIMLYIQFGLEGVHAWNWMNTSAYIIMGVGFVVALFRELKQEK